MNADDREKKAFDFTADLTKQLITLSTGIVTLTLLLSKDLGGPKLLAAFAWSCFLISTLCGLWALMALTGTLAPLTSTSTPKENQGPPKADSNIENASLTIGSNVRTPSTLQIGAFGVAILLTLVFVFTVTLKVKTPVQKPVDACCTCTGQH